MNRQEAIDFLDANPDFLWDILVIGGGATGLGIALDASLRGLKTLLIEQNDFTKGTSSRSTKLVHGGVRYLAQGDVQLVMEALKERGLLLKNAPHITNNQAFIVPTYNWFDTIKLSLGLRLYDFLAGKLSLGKSKLLNKKEVVSFLPTIETKGLKAGILYHDGQFDDARLGIHLAQSVVDQGGYVINYFKAETFIKSNTGKLEGLVAKDVETGRTYSLKSKVVVNATGVFVDDLLQKDNKNTSLLVRPSQGTHIVIDKHFLPTDYALMIPKTTDGRVLFAIPWHDKLLVGTTDTSLEEAQLEPKPILEEVDFILENLTNYVTQKPTRNDVLSVFSGLRPLARPSKEGKSTKEISRNHKIVLSESGLISITGGKWTTYRKMAEEIVDKASSIASLPISKSKTNTFRIHGFSTLSYSASWENVYGTDNESIKSLIKSDSKWGDRIHSSYTYTKAEIVWSVRFEMARTLEDLLARRLRLLFLDAKAAIDSAPVAAEILQHELQKTESWKKDQILSFQKLANNYLLKPYFPW